MNCLIAIHSAQDCRAVPLFPCICGDDGAVQAFGAEKFVRRCLEVRNPEGCVCGVWYCATCCTVHYTELDCVPNELKRLGPKSRALVMSLYRAIIERFFIMRATGCDCERPTSAASGTFGFNPLFLESNCCQQKRDLAGENSRRAFGGTFRDAMKTLVGEYTATGGSETKCGVHFYPITPQSPIVSPTPFMPCAREYADGTKVCWWPGSCAKYDKIIADCTGSWRTAPWVYDNSMQRDLSGEAERCHRLRPLLKDVAAAYRTFMYNRDDICAFVGWHLDDAIQDNRLKSISDCGAPLSCCCGIHDFKTAMGRFMDGYGCMNPPRFWLPALGLALRMLSTLNAQTVRRCGCVTIPHKRITANFTLPLGVVDRHFVVGRERSCFTICDVNLPCAVTCAHLIYSNGFASYKTMEHYFNLADRDWPPETISVTCERPVYERVCTGTCYSDPYPHYACVCTGTCYTPPYPHYVCRCDCACFYCGCYSDPYPHYECVYCGCYSDPYPHYECVCVGTCECTYCTCNPNRSYVCAACILRWGTRAWCTGTSGDQCASVTMRAIWPNLSAGGFQFGGRAYPARWAVRECDVAFGAVSAFVMGRTCNERTWVVNKTDNPKSKLGSCKDLMTVLGREIIKAGLKRAMCDQGGGGVCGNTFSGTNFPTSAGAAALEMVGENHANNVRVIRCVAEASEPVEGGGTSLSYHHLRVLDCGGLSEIRAYPTEDESSWNILVPSTLWYDGKWLHLGTSGGGSIGFSYDRDYEKTGGCGGCSCGCDCDCGGGYSSTCVRHGWSLPRSSVQFGGFFGTFIFNNRSARQTT